MSRIEPAQGTGPTPGQRRGGDLLALLGLIALAALLRLPNLATRGTWDGDQGHDMLVLWRWIHEGAIPLLGPPTSIGDVHHGALYYYLLAPAAFLTGGASPLAVVSEIALAGIAAVGVTWWLARSIGGSVAGLVAGAILAVSTSAVDGSTFIWNPNLIALSSSIALAGAWRAWSTGNPSWWLLAAAGTAVTVQCHVLGIAMVPVIGALLVLDVRRGVGADRAAVVRVGLVSVLIVGFSYLPLLVHELGADFSEWKAFLAYLGASDGAGSGLGGVVGRFSIVSLRVVTWPLTGLVTQAIVPALVAAVGLVCIVVFRWRAPEPNERLAIRWLALGLLWTCAFLTVAAPSLAVVVPGLPNDHYHAFADPMVVVIIGLGAGAAWRGVARARSARRETDDAPADAVAAADATGSAASAEAAADATGSAASAEAAAEAAAAAAPRALAIVGGLAAAIGVVALLVFNLVTQPPAVHPDGGFPDAAEAATRIQASTGRELVTLRSLPSFKSTEAYGYPLVRDGIVVTVADPASASPFAGPNLVVICDALFEEAIGAPCGGPAERTLVDSLGSAAGMVLADRFEAAPGRTISVFLAVE